MCRGPASSLGRLQALDFAVKLLHCITLHVFVAAYVHHSETTAVGCALVQVPNVALLYRGSASGPCRRVTNETLFIALGSKLISPELAGPNQIVAVLNLNRSIWIVTGVYV